VLSRADGFEAHRHLRARRLLRLAAPNVGYDRINFGHDESLCYARKNKTPAMMGQMLAHSRRQAAVSFALITAPPQDPH
jgi:hypothetical protein